MFARVAAFVFRFSNNLRQLRCRIQHAANLRMQRLQEFLFDALAHRVIPMLFCRGPHRFQLSESFFKSRGRGSEISAFHIASSVVECWLVSTGFVG